MTDAARGSRLAARNGAGATGALRAYKDLRVWQAAMDLVVQIYRATDAFPSDERFGLTSQLRRAVVSVPSNIAEGHATGSDGSFGRYLAIAAGSLAEVETQVEVARRLGFLPNDADLDDRLDKVGRMLRRLRQQVEA
jgi:four helix bundle protein